MYGDFGQKLPEENCQDLSYMVYCQHHIDMEVLRLKSWKTKYQTFLQYFLSYIALVILCLTGILIIINAHMKQEMFGAYEKQSSLRLENLSGQISNLTLSLNQTAMALSNNEELLYSRYFTTSYTRITVTRELAKYSSANSVLQSMIYLDLKNEDVYSINAGIIMDAEYLSITLGNQLRETYRLPYRDLISWETNQIYSFPAEGGAKPPMLVYYPPQESESYAILFILNYSELLNLLEIGVSHEVPAIAIADGHDRIIAATDMQGFVPYLSEDAVLVPSSDSRSCRKFSTDLPSLNLYAVFDESVLEGFIDRAFKTVYIGILAIGILGVLLSIIFLNVTYYPLHRLATRLFNTHPAGEAETQIPGGDLRLISKAFDTIRTENEKLLQKIRNYRVMVQKSILDSLTSSDETSHLTAYIDNMFDSAIQNHFLALCFHSLHGEAEPDLRASLADALSPDVTVLLLETTPARVSFLLNFTGPSRPNIEALAEDLRPLNCRISFSDLSSNPLDISRLYNNAVVASQYGGDAFAFYQEAQPWEAGSGLPVYPYQLFDSLAADLQAFRYEDALQTVEALFQALGQIHNPEFFIRCTLIDTITLIVGAMNASNVPFDGYSSLYYDLLYLCRNTDYASTQSEIYSKIKDLISILAGHMADGNLNIHRIRRFIEDQCLSPDFSVSMTADHFGVTTAYMSYLFKKKSSSNFSDYVWGIRLERAKQLLQQTDLPIEEVGSKVGYENSSSFRRKFKDSTGLTPSQYRSGLQPGG